MGLLVPHRCSLMCVQLMMAECRSCLHVVDLGCRTLSPGPRTPWADGPHARGLVRPGPLGGQKTPEGQLDAWGGPSVQNWAPRLPGQIVLVCATPPPLAPGTDGAWEVDGRTPSSLEGPKVLRETTGRAEPYGGASCQVVSGPAACTV